MHQRGVHHGEVARHVRFDIEVLVGRLDRLRHAADVGDRRRRRDRHHIGIAHADGLDPRTQRLPVERGGTIEIKHAAPRTGQIFDRIYRQDTPAPQRAVERGIAATLGGEIDRGGNGVEAQRFHALIGKGHGGVRRIRQAQDLDRIMEAHDAEPDRAMLQVGAARLRDGVEIDVDHVVEHPHRGLHRAGELGLVEARRRDMRNKIDRTEVADGDFGVRGVERDLGAEIRRMHHADVILRRADVAGILERDPGMPGLEQHGQHLAPEVDRAQRLEHPHFTACGLGFIGLISPRKRRPVQIVQLGSLVGREQRPWPVGLDALHEQVRHPVGGVHVVGAAAVVTGILAQIEEFLDVDMPGLEIGADRALALAALVDRDGGVVGDFQERHHALALAIGALDVGAEPAHPGPVVAEPAGILRQQRVVLDRLEDAVEIIRHAGEEAGRQLRPQRARIEQSGRRRHEIERRQELVEFDGAGFAVDFPDGDAHGDAHEEGLRQFEPGAVHVQEIAVVQRLQPQELELLVALRLQRGRKPLQIEPAELGIEQLVGDANIDICLLYTSRCV